MATPETLPEAPKQDEEQKDESKVSQKHWPWIVLGLCFALIKVYSDGKEKDLIIAQCTNDRVKDSKDLAFAWEQVAQERRDLKASTAFLLRYTNDTSIIRRIDSAKNAEFARSSN